MRRILSFVIKELIQLRRDKRMIGIVLISPIIQLILLGYAANLDVKTIGTTILDFDNSTLSRKFVQTLLSSKYFQINKYAKNYYEIKKDIESGRAIVCIVFPKDFEKNLIRHRTSSIQVILDASNGNKTSIVFGYLANATAQFNKLHLGDFQIQNRSFLYSSLPRIQPEIRVWYNPNMETRKFFLPGIVALLLLIIAIPLTAMAIVREKEIGTIEQILISPAKSFEIVAGKLIPFLLVGLLDFTFVLSVMVFWFGIEVRGSVLLLYFTGFLFTLSNLGLGLFISTISKTQQQAMILSVFGIIVPMIYLSGFVFPIENMPKIIQTITFLIPLRYFLVILRGIVLKGIGIFELWDQILILSAYGVAFFLLSLIRFRKTLH
ncbi:ABC transporter permease [Bacteroidetes/Chlorobi group bacterium Naka2016]|jgi:ABC-2 type transport system permease protein|nr:MAG: ABC transporter permease [Bacteroidetes/Chlorobi group bacterium Naka2016]